ncbi:MAG: nucleotidyltransferase family protein [Gammaproteobacteria bacterium]|nr:nucleotidyltransferase family protein [Gammaproteobacteria bacterium]
MKIAGFIAEFNPFTRGHEYFIKKIKSEYSVSTLVVMMSPNFTLRGEAAIFNKFERAKIALENGVDLVAEIPTLYAIENASVYARKGVELLNSLKVDTLFCGAECDTLSTLLEIVDLTYSDKYKELFEKFKSEGHSFNSSYKKAISILNKDFEEIVKMPNNVLAIEYIKAIKELNLDMKVILIKRVETNYFDDIKINKTIQSASAIRESIYSGTFKKEYLGYNIDNYTVHNIKDYFELIKYRIESSSAEELKEILGVTEGFEYALKGLKRIDSYDSLVESLVSKRNRETKVKRILLSILLNIKKEELKTPINNYVRILAFNGCGRAHLKMIKNNCFIIDSIKRNLPKELYREIDFTKIYSIPYKEAIESLEYEPIIKD